MVFNPEALGHAVPLQGGGTGSGPGGPASTFALNFTNANLVAGILTVNHNLPSSPASTTIRDDTNFEIVPDDVEFINVNTLEIDLSSYAPIVGTWRVLVIGE